VPNYGDIREIDWKEVNDRYGIIDVYIGGSPCQNFSVAGNRLGLLGTESRLMYEYIRAIKELLEASGGTSPRYVVFENVPGALSSGPKGAKGSDFQCLLRELDECGYGLAWRVLDSQFAGVLRRESGRWVRPVPQRRRRVFLVGSLGTDGAGDILFERTCLQGNHPKGREAREALARDSESCAGMGDSAGFKYHQGSAAGGVGYEPGQPRR
jgi:DNA (cytosine-5)-methyltransferase 1